MYHSKSIVDIIRENDIPHTTCYRKTKWLLNEGLVTVDKIVITPEGKKFSLYHSVLRSINVRYESNSVAIVAEENFDIVKRMMAHFHSWRDGHTRVTITDQLIYRCHFCCSFLSPPSTPMPPSPPVSLSTIFFLFFPYNKT